MNTLRERLRDADPLRHEDALASTDAARMRNAILAAAAADVPPLRVPWLALAATSLAVVAGIVLTERGPVSAARQARSSAIDTAVVVTTPRQLQFATPGGTRVIWMFNAEFDGR